MKFLKNIAGQGFGFANDERGFDKDVSVCPHTETPAGIKQGKIKESFNDERGFALVLAIVIMAAMTAIGIAAIVTATTDVLIARNEEDAKKAFYLAETGAEDAIGRTGLPGGHLSFLGEDSTEMRNRRAGLLPVYAGDNFATAGYVGQLKGNYNGTIGYALEGETNWCNGDGCLNNEVVLYCTGFQFVGTGVPTICANAVPVYRITSTGRTNQETSATITEYIASSTFNVAPPAGDIWAKGDITASGGSSGTGTECGAACSDDTVNMDTYLGMTLDEIEGYADSPSPYYNPGTLAAGDTNNWGNICNTNDNPVVDAPVDILGSPADTAAHICDNESKIIYIEGNVRISANTTGRGLLVIRGDLALAGDLKWEGMIYIIGNLAGAGNVSVFGTMMANGTMGFTGSLLRYGSVDIAMSIADQIGVPRILRWARQ